MNKLNFLKIKMKLKIIYNVPLCLQNTMSQTSLGADPASQKGLVSV